MECCRCIVYAMLPLLSDLGIVAVFISQQDGQKLASLVDGGSLVYAHVRPAGNTSRTDLNWTPSEEDYDDYIEDMVHPLAYTLRDICIVTLVLVIVLVIGAVAFVLRSLGYCKVK